jgi:hypothetical protein
MVYVSDIHRVSRAVGGSRMQFLSKLLKKKSSVSHTLRVGLNHQPVGNAGEFRAFVRLRFGRRASSSGIGGFVVVGVDGSGRLLRVDRLVRKLCPSRSVRPVPDGRYSRRTGRLFGTPVCGMTVFLVINNKYLVAAL